MRIDGGPAAVEPHDRFILRSLSPGHTVGGGIVLDAAPRRFRATPPQLAFCPAVAAGDVSRALPAARGRPRRGRPGRRRAGRGRHRAEAARRTLAALAAAGELETVAQVVHGAQGAAPVVPGAASPGRGGPAATAERRFFAAGTLAAVVAALDVPLSRAAAAAPREPLRGALRAGRRRAALSARRVRRPCGRPVAPASSSSASGGYARAGAGDALSPAHEALAARVGERLAAARFAPPTLASLEEELAPSKRDLRDGPRSPHAARRRCARRQDLWFATRRGRRGARAPRRGARAPDRDHPRRLPRRACHRTPPRPGAARDLRFRGASRVAAATCACCGRAARDRAPGRQRDGCRCESELRRRDDAAAPCA